MKKGILFIFLFSVIISSQLFSDHNAETITFNSLLDEMVDRDHLTYSVNGLYKTLQASSYNRASTGKSNPGWFADSDGEGFIRIEENDGKKEWVIMEHQGPGAIVKIWAVCFYYGLANTVGSNIKIYLDGSSEPVINSNFFDLVQGKSLFKSPFAQESTRAGNCYFPVTYAKSCKITVDKKAFYNIINYRAYKDGTKVETFTIEKLKASQEHVIEAGKVLLKSKSNTQKEDRILNNFDLPVGARQTIPLPKGSHAVRELSIKLYSKDINQALRSTVLKAKFDDEMTIWTPVGDFFNNGVDLETYKMWGRETSEDGNMVCKWVMPYEEGASFEIENYGIEDISVSLEIVVGNYGWTKDSMHFFSAWNMKNPLPTFPIFDLNLIKINGEGCFIGDQFTVLNPSEGWWGEGDEKIYVDSDFDSDFPSHFGTGTEDYYGWAGGVVPNPADQFSQPFLGNIRVGSPNAIGYNTCSRTRSLDAIPFDNQFKFDMEASCGTRNSWFHLLYSWSVYWYAKPGSTHNGVSQTNMASLKIMTLDQLQSINRIKKESLGSVENAIEAETIPTFILSPGVKKKNNRKIRNGLSGGKMSNFQFSKNGQTVSVKLTERFHDADIKVGLVTGAGQGSFEVFVNDHAVRLIELTASPWSPLGVSTIELGRITPVNNCYEIKFVYKKNIDSSVQKEMLGIDYFIIDDSAFMNRNE